jgi:hypothetical protein
MIVILSFQLNLFSALLLGFVFSKHLIVYVLFSANSWFREEESGVTQWVKKKMN